MPAILSMAVGSLFADPKPTMVVQMVETHDAEAYANMMVKANALIKAGLGVGRLRHVWLGDYAGENAHKVFVVSEYPSVADIYKGEEKLKNYPEIDTLMAQLKDMRHLGYSALYKAVRYDGIYEGGSVFNTGVTCSDEDAYLKQLDGLKAIFDANGFTDAKVNLWRIISGRTTATHLVVIALPSQLRTAELLDALSDKGLLKDWYVGAAKVRTSLQNGTYHEITK